jgi:hypothetical protein
VGTHVIHISVLLIGEVAERQQVINLYSNLLRLLLSFLRSLFLFAGIFSNPKGEVQWHEPPREQASAHTQLWCQS